VKDESNPYAAPKAQEAAPQPTLLSKVPASAGNLELRIKTPVAPVCLKCAATEKIQRREEIFTWSVRRRRSFWLWYSLLGLLGGLGAKLFNKDNDRTAKLSLPLCSECNARWGIAKALTTIGWGTAVLVLVLARNWVDPFGAFVLLMAAIGAALLMAYDLKKQSLQALYIDDEIVVLAGSKPVVVEKLAEARAELEARATPKKGMAKRHPVLREPDAIEDAISHESGGEHTLSLDSVASDERDAGR
jgi:hypothetical protein